MTGRDDERGDAGPRTAAGGVGDQAGEATLRSAVVSELARQLARPPLAGLTLVATPIGNLGDMSLRAIATLAQADLILCEDTRVSRTLLAHFGIGRPLRPVHDHNEEAEAGRVLDEIGAGRAVALISDAGMPLVCDPGFKLVRAVAAAGHRVSIIPGPSAPLAALAISGLPSDAFLFAGFLPPRAKARRTRLTELAAVPATLVLLETAPRLAETLADIAAVLGSRETVVAREITKRYEEVRRGLAGVLAAAFAAAPVKGELVLLVAPPLAATVDDALIERQLESACERLSMRDAVQEVARALDVSRARVYALALRLKGAGSDPAD